MLHRYSFPPGGYTEIEFGAPKACPACSHAPREEHVDDFVYPFGREGLWTATCPQPGCGHRVLADSPVNAFREWDRFTT